MSERFWSNLYGHRAELHRALGSVTEDSASNFYDTVRRSIEQNRQIFICGNGGSAAIAAHFATDLLKGASTTTTIKPKIISLCDNVSLMTAIGNDLSYDEVFAYQLERLGSGSDLLICVSSSGNSMNIRRAIETALNKNMYVVSVTGMNPENNVCYALSDACVFIESYNYATIEDASMSFLHSVSRTLRQEFANPGVDVNCFTF